MSGHRYESMDGLSTSPGTDSVERSRTPEPRAKQDARADESMDRPARAKQDARIRWAYFRLRWQTTLCQDRDGVIIAAGPRWSPRDGQLLTPSGPEGSSGSDDAGCRGAAGAGHFHYIRYIARTIHESFGLEFCIEAGSCVRLWLHCPIPWQLSAGTPRFLQFTG